MQRFRAMARRQKILGCGGVAVGFLTMTCILVGLFAPDAAENTELDSALVEPTATIVSSSTSTIDGSTPKVPTATAVPSQATNTPRSENTATATKESAEVAVASPTNVQVAESEPSPTSVPATIPPMDAEPIEFIQVNGGAPNSIASVSVQAAPNIECDIGYTTPAGTSSEAEGLFPKSTGPEGAVSWEWEIGPRTNPGTGRVVVTCEQDSSTADIIITE